MFQLANASGINSCNNDGGSADWTEVPARTAFHKQGYPEQRVFIRNRHHGGLRVDADYWVLSTGKFVFLGNYIFIYFTSILLVVVS